MHQCRRALFPTSLCCTVRLKKDKLNCVVCVYVCGFCFYQGGLL